MAKKYTLMGRKRDAVRLGDALKDVYSEYKLDGELENIEIKNIWDNMMGKAISNNTSYIKLMDGVLLIKLNSPVLKQELSFAKEKIKSHINSMLGKEAVKQVVLN